MVHIGSVDVEVVSVEIPDVVKLLVSGGKTLFKGVEELRTADALNVELELLARVWHAEPATTCKPNRTRFATMSAWSL